VLLLCGLALVASVFADTNLTLTAHAGETKTPASATATSNAPPATITIDGTTYSNVTWRTVTPSTVTIFHQTGVATIPLAKLSPDLQKQFGYDPQKASDWQAAQQKAAADVAKKKAEKIAEQQALEKKWAAAQWWSGAVDEILPDGIIVVMHSPGYIDHHRVPTNPLAERHPDTVVDSQDFYLLLVGHPKRSTFAEGEGIDFYAYKDGVVTVGGDTLEKWVYCEPPPGKKQRLSGAAES